MYVFNTFGALGFITNFFKNCFTCIATTEINFWEIIIVIEWVMTFLEKNYNFFWVFYGYSDFKTCKMIKIEFNKQIIDRCDSKIDFREKMLYIKNHIDLICAFL